MSQHAHGILILIHYKNWAIREYSVSEPLALEKTSFLFECICMYTFRNSHTQKPQEDAMSDTHSSKSYSLAKGFLTEQSTQVFQLGCLAGQSQWYLPSHHNNRVTGVIGHIQLFCVWALGICTNTHGWATGLICWGIAPSTGKP